MKIFYGWLHFCNYYFLTTFINRETIIVFCDEKCCSGYIDEFVRVMQGYGVFLKGTELNINKNNRYNIYSKHRILRDLHCSSNQLTLLLGTHLHIAVNTYKKSKQFGIFIFCEYLVLFLGLFISLSLHEYLRSFQNFH